MIRKTLPIQLQTITWLNGGVIDWSLAGRYYTPDGQQQELGKSHYSGSPFDACISSTDGRYALLYARLGTKGLLLKGGELLREVNRSDYRAEDYEYPAAFFEAQGRTYLAHCPQEYNRLEFEDVETGEIPTDVPEREPTDIFHSRLEINPGNTYLLSKGWVWHPWDVVQAFDIEACLKNPLLLDDSTMRPSVGTEISSASFLSEHIVLLAASSEEAMNEELEHLLPPLHVAWWDIRSNELTLPVKVAGQFGNLVAIDENQAWDFYSHPKIINLGTGAVDYRWEEVDSGRQGSAIRPPTHTQIVVSPDRRTAVVRTENSLEFIGL